MSEAAAIKFPEDMKGSAFRNTDWNFLLITLIVTALYSAIVIWSSNIPIPEPTDEDIKRLQDQFAMFVLKEKPIEEEPVEEAASDAGEQTAAQEKAESRVEERKSASAEEKAEARKAQAAERAAAREKAAAAVANVGALAMLTAVGDGGDDDGGDQVEDLLGSGGVQSGNLGQALSSLDGLKAGGTGAATGRGRRGKRGGTGAAGGGGVDDLLSGIGTAGSRSLARKGAISLAKPGAVKSSGSASKSANRNVDAINGVIKKKQGAIQFCFKKELRKNPNLSGKITVRFTIGANGRVAKASITGSSIKSRSLESCLLRTIRRLKFKPIASTEGSMTVTYPFVFTSG